MQDRVVPLRAGSSGGRARGRLAFGVVTVAIAGAVALGLALAHRGATQDAPRAPVANEGMVALAEAPCSLPVGWPAFEHQLKRLSDRDLADLLTFSKAHQRDRSLTYGAFLGSMNPQDLERLCDLLELRRDQRSVAAPAARSISRASA